MYNFDYFYGNEAEQYQFYMIPQLLFTDKKFKKISTDGELENGTYRITYDIGELKVCSTEFEIE